MSKSLKRVRAALEAAAVELHIHELENTRSAADAAAAVGCDLDQIVKSVIFADTEHARAVLFMTAGGNQVDAAKASAVAGVPLGKADAALIRAQTGFAIGGVAPIGHLSPIRAFWDPRLSAFDEVWAAAGTPRHVFGIAPARLLEITGAEVAAFTT